MATAKSRGTAGKLAAERQAKGAGTRSRSRRAKAKPVEVEEMVVEYEFSNLTLRKVRYDAVDPDNCFGADRQYLSKEALGVTSEKDVPKTLTVRITAA